jgi:hypothetical protein
MQEDLALDTATRKDNDRELEWDVYLSYAESDREVAQRISDRLEQLGIHAFDERYKRVGLLDISERQRGMEHSKRLAVLLGPGHAIPLERADADQVVANAVGSERVVFLIYLPGFDPDVRPPPPWLPANVAVDLRAGFDEESRADLTRLVSGALAPMEYREAEQRVRALLDGGKPGAQQAGVLRALVVGVADHRHYSSLQDTVEADLRAVEGLLSAEADGRNWQVTRLAPEHRDELLERADTFFRSAGNDDTVLFYFTGHGDLDDNDPQLVVTHTDPQDLYRTAFGVSRLANFVRSSPARQRIVVLDCCYAGEAGDDAFDWGAGAAVLTSSRRWVAATGTTSELTAALTAQWQARPATAGELLDALACDIDVHTNRDFARALVLPRPIGLPASAAAVVQAVRLTVDHAGELNVKISPGTWSVPSGPLAATLADRRDLVKNLLDIVDAVIAYAPREGVLIERVNATVKALGDDLLSSTLTAQVRAALDEQIESWSELHLELSFDEAWADRDWWERLLWESLLLCRDKNRPVTIERIVPAAAVKSGTTVPRPRRAIAWNALSMPTVRLAERSASQPLLAYLLGRSLERSGVQLTTLSEQTSTWQTLFGASMGKKEISASQGEPGISITEFDTFVLFAELSLANGEPQVWLRRSADRQPEQVQASSLIEKLQKWACSRIVIETVASDRRVGCLEATTILAARMARQLGVPVVGVCHSPQYAAAAKGMAEGEGYMPSFSGDLLKALTRSGVSVAQAATEARTNVADGVGFPESVHVGLPIVCRPERLTPSRPSGQPLAKRPNTKAEGP